MHASLSSPSVHSRIIRQFLFMLLLVFIAALPGKLQAQGRVTDSNFLYLADPAIYFEKGTYYLYGTGARDGFPVYTSTNLKEWSRLTTANGGYALKQGDAFGTAQFWAPQVFLLNKQYYMAYAANEQISIATAKAPSGPFTGNTREPLAAPVKQIDPFVFTDDDGKKYLYHVRLSAGNGIYVAELNDDLTSIKPETLHECIRATEPWENTAKSEWPVAEGPSVLKHGGYYYLFYSANDFRNKDYAVGYAVSKSPYGPWTKWSGNPIISRNLLPQSGTGHGDFINVPGKKLLYVLHTHYSDSVVSPRKTALISMQFVKDGKTGIDKVVADPASFFFLRPSRKQ